MTAQLPDLPTLPPVQIKKHKPTEVMAYATQYGQQCYAAGVQAEREQWALEMRIILAHLEEGRSIIPRNQLRMFMDARCPNMFRHYEGVEDHRP